MYILQKKHSNISWNSMQGLFMSQNVMRPVNEIFYRCMKRWTLNNVGQKLRFYLVLGVQCYQHGHFQNEILLSFIASYSSDIDIKVMENVNQSIAYLIILYLLHNQLQIFTANWHFCMEYIRCTTLYMIFPCGIFSCKKIWRWKWYVRKAWNTFCIYKI